MAREWVYRPVIRTALGLFRVLGFRFSIEGVDNVPASGGAVLASNHISYFDFMVIGLAPHRRGKRLVRFMAKKSVFDNVIAGPLMRGMHHIPVDRSAGAGAYRAAVTALKEGELVGVFPEQTISRSFVPRPFKSGAARMALESGAPLIPVAVWGPHRIWTVGRKPKLRRRIPVTLLVGEPLPMPSGTTVEVLTSALEVAIGNLVKRAQQQYPVTPQAGDDWWQPAWLGGSAPTPEVALAADKHAIAGRRPEREAS